MFRCRSRQAGYSCINHRAHREMAKPSGTGIERLEVFGVNAKPVSAGLHYLHTPGDRPNECLITDVLRTLHTEIAALIPDLEATVTTVGYLPGPLPAAALTVL
jgi:hypothetical protein